jgi:hypothetical protein
MYSGTPRSMAPGSSSRGQMRSTAAATVSYSSLVSARCEVSTTGGGTVVADFFGSDGLHPA